jgi:hypothetical protein
VTLAENRGWRGGTHPLLEREVHRQKGTAKRLGFFYSAIFSRQIKRLRRSDT